MVYGVTARGLPWTYGTTQNLTIQTFDYSGTDDLSNAVLTAQVPGFGVSMDCAPAQVNNLSSALQSRPWLPAGILAEYLVGDISSPDCQLTGVSLGQTPGHMYFQENFDPSTGWKSNYQGFFDYYVCNSGYNYVNYGNPDVPQPHATSPEQYRFLLTMSEVTFWYNGTSGSLPSSSQTTNWTIAQSTAVLCRPSYSIDLYDVTLAPLNRTLLRAEKISNTSIDLIGFDLGKFLDGIVNSLSVADFGEGGPDYVIAPVPQMFLLLEALLTDAPNGSLLKPLIQPDLLQNVSTQALEGIGTQFADQYLKQAKSEPLTGSYMMTQQRLQVKRLTVGLLLTALGLLVITVLVLIKFRPWDTAPCTTESLASAAIILASSKALRSHMQTGQPDLDNSVRNLESREYQTVVGPEGLFEIQPVVAPSVPTASLHSKEDKSKKELSPWWRPIATRKWFSVCILLVPLILIAVLEVIQHVSDRKQGIVTLDSSDSYHLTISYIPLAVMLLVALLYGSLDATASAFAPFLALRRGSAQAERSISASLLSKLPPHAFYLSLRNRHWVNTFTILAATVSSFLTIVTSGLYSPVTVQSPHAVQMQQLSVMNLSHVDLSEGDNLAGETTKLMMLFNLSNPVGTYDDLVFPSFEAHIPDALLGGIAPNEEVLISMTMPALRPSLQCTVAPVDSITTADNVYHSGTMQVLVDGTYTYADPGEGIFSTQKAVFPWSLGTSNTTLVKEPGGSADWSYTYIIPNDTETSVPKTQIGATSPVQWIADGKTLTAHQTSTEHTGKLDVDPSTANFGFAGGWASGTRTNQVVNISLDGANTFMANTWKMQTDLVITLCYQILEEVQTNVTFNWPSMTTNQDNPPVADQATARIIMSNETSTPTWKMNTTVTSASPHWFGISLNMFLWALQDNTTAANCLNAWFTTLQNRKGGQPLSELLGQANQDGLIKASNDMYARYAAQAINANMRASGKASGQDLPSYNATILVPVLRLKQNKGPKIVLQVLLAVMAVCGAVAYSLLNTKELLRQSPCSIAGKMELLARSELCNTRKVIPEGAEWWDGRQRKRMGLFDGWFFSLGWWGDEMKWYGIDTGRAEKVQ
ncbi:hypothetical protein A1O3_05617 [Capronia epimyces CBS 606.96]|uniref:Uncharacterized protein n=1 Tax=Capronia epimyces CBS 606.96 TaxID=1182542 RepID=W9XWL7_9EURO|nr:uncharacterized protein A1O3_05617 [Capronia epimyces CBS 606.96]EXJ84942.1 hypothetical protein A1O3_05617 [Capronia epimyces CBS 606.96]